MNAPVSAKALDGWHNFAAVHGVTTAALIEAMGLRLAEMATPERLPDFLRASVTEARTIAAKRRSRSRQRRSAQ